MKNSPLHSQPYLTHFTARASQWDRVARRLWHWTPRSLRFASSSLTPLDLVVGVLSFYAFLMMLLLIGAIIYTHWTNQEADFVQWGWFLLAGGGTICAWGLVANLVLVRSAELTPDQLERLADFLAEHDMREVGGDILLQWKTVRPLMVKDYLRVARAIRMIYPQTEHHRLPMWWRWTDTSSRANKPARR